MRYKHILVGKPINLDELRPVPKEHSLTPRQIAQRERDAELRRAINEASAAAESQAIPISLKDGQKMATMRAAMTRLIKETGSTVHMGVRGETIYLSRGPIPGGRGRWGRPPS
ncbi:MAG TPA: hypothetical protein VNF73_15265 [Candidatus Saccharimonadales bacterium]|nr:hypothetical protein [Candidatus Saccharimonadales bacterium]